MNTGGASSESTGAFYTNSFSSRVVGGNDGCYYMNIYLDASKSIVSWAKENDIILMHDYYPTTITAAFRIIDNLKEQGYEFVTVEEILFD